MGIGLKRGMVELSEHEPEWINLATEAIERLWRIFESIAKDIQHIGSTAILSIKAKPIIDIAVAVDEFTQIKALIPAMEKEGFVVDYGIRDSDWHGFIVYSDSTRSVDTYHIHIVKYNSAKWQGFLRFRDYMNTNPHVAQKYEACKIKSIEKSKNDNGRSAYTDNKNDFIARILKDSLE